MRRAADFAGLLTATIILSSCSSLDLSEIDEAAGARIAAIPIKNTVADASPARSAFPSLDGLGLTMVGPPDDGPADAKKWLRKITVDVPNEGDPRVGKGIDVSRWRGIALPRDEGQRPIPGETPPEVFVNVARDGTIRAGGLAIESAGALRATLRDILEQKPGLRIVFDADRAAPWGEVIKAVAVAADACPDLLFQAPSLPHGPEQRAVVEKLLGAALQGRADPVCAVASAESGEGPQVLGNNCLRIRADARASYESVQQAMVVAMMNYVWRISFVGVIEGREVEIGVAYDKSGDPPAKPPILNEGPPELERATIVRDDATGKAILRTEDKVVESKIGDIPLGGTGVVSGMGIGGPGLGSGPVFGFRTGGGRRRAAIRGGGSRASVKAVEAAHAWLARNQEPDGRWSSAKFGGGEGLDVAATGLATLSLLGAGNTEKQGRYKATVRRAVAWLVGNQSEDGCLADAAANRARRAGRSHAIAALALAEAYGMARVRRTGAAAQKAVDYSTGVHQREYSGWGEAPKADPDTLVTAWFTAQLKSAKIAGLKVKGLSFAGSITWLDKVTDLPDKAAGKSGGAARVRPGETPSPTATAIAVFARQVMGWKRTDPIITGGADFVLAHLTKCDAETLDREFLYWGGLGMFQMGGERWKTWNARVRDMLVSTQRMDTEDPELDGSWNPVAAEANLGRVGATALASMCLEVYYRYLPLYK